jgi:hypothetical protein
MHPAAQQEKGAWKGGYASMAVTDQSLEDRTAFTLGLDQGDFRIGNRTDSGVDIVKTMKRCGIPLLRAGHGHIDGTICIGRHVQQEGRARSQCIAPRCWSLETLIATA